MEDMVGELNELSANDANFYAICGGQVLQVKIWKYLF
jgi:hypothetical protein